MPSAMIIDDVNFDVVFKILMIGNSCVGKTSFLRRFVDRKFHSKISTTLGIDLEAVTILRTQRKVRLQIWDTAGQERFRALGTSFYRLGMGFILLYDITNEASFLDVTRWLADVKTHTGENAGTRIILVGNKSDLENERVVPEKRGRELAETHGLPFFEASAKVGDNVNEVFEHMIDLLLEDAGENGTPQNAMIPKLEQSFKLQDEQEDSQGKTRKSKCLC